MKDLKILYNTSMEKVHFIKQKNKKHGIFYVAGIRRLDPNNPGFSRMFVIKDEAGATYSDKRKAMQRYFELKREEIAEAKKEELLIPFLLKFWSPNSTYIKTKLNTKTKISLSYVAQQQGLICNHFQRWAKDNDIVYPSQLTKLRAQEWFLHSVDEARNKGFKPSTANNTKKALSVAFKWLCKMDKLEINPFTFVDAADGEAEEAVPFLADEVKRMFSSPWPSMHAQTAAIMAARLGCRIGEIIGLRWANVHLKEKYIDIVEQFQEHQGRGLCPPKWRSIRLHVGLDETLIFALQKMKEGNPSKNAQFVFWGTSNDVPIRRATVTVHFNQGLALCGVERNGRSWHAFRHFFVSEVSSRLGRERASRIIGHRTENTTMGYDHVDEADQNEALRAVKEALG